MKIEEKVSDLISKYNEHNPFKLAEALGVYIEYHNLGKVYGYHTKYRRVSIIRINGNLTYEKQLFACAHELGHHVLHPDVSAPFLNEKTLFSTSKIETEAHIFALELLFFNQYIIKENELELYGIPKHIALFKKFNL